MVRLYFTPTDQLFDTIRTKNLTFISFQWLITSHIQMKCFLTLAFLFLQHVTVKESSPHWSSGPCPGQQPSTMCASGAPVRPQCAQHKVSGLQAGGKGKETLSGKQNTLFLSCTSQPRAIFNTHCVFSSCCVDLCCIFVILQSSDIVLRHTHTFLPEATYITPELLVPDLN